MECYKLNSAGNEFTFEYFTEDYDTRYSEDKKGPPPIYRHTPLSEDMQILVRHPDTVVVGETQQKFFVVPEYCWENAIPFEEHKRAQMVFELIERGVTGLRERYKAVNAVAMVVEVPLGYDLEKRYGNVFGEGKSQRARIMSKVVDSGLDQIFSSLSIPEFIPEELTGNVQDGIGEKLKDRYKEIFDEEEGRSEPRKGYSTTRIPIHLTPKFRRVHTAYSLTIPFSGKLSETDEVFFWLDPAFGNPSASSKQADYPIGFARLDPVRIKLNLNLERKVKEKPFFASSRTLEWYLPTEEETAGMIVEDIEIEKRSRVIIDPTYIRDPLVYLNLKYYAENPPDKKFRVFQIPIINGDNVFRFGLLIRKMDAETKSELLKRINEQEVIFPVILKKDVMIAPCFNHPYDIRFEQEGILLNFLLRYHHRVGGDILYKDEIMIKTNDLIRKSKPDKKVTSEDTTKAIFESWELQRRYYDGTFEEAVNNFKRRLFPLIEGTSLESFHLMQRWQEYLKEMPVERMDVEKEILGNGWLTIPENLRRAYLYGLRDVVMAKYLR